MYCYGLSQMGFPSVAVITDDSELAFAILVDIRPTAILTRLLPGKFALDLTRSIRATPLLANTPIVILTSVSHPSQEKEALAAGANGIYLLPQTPDRTAEILHRLIDADLLPATC